MCRSQTRENDVVQGITKYEPYIRTKARVQIII